MSDRRVRARTANCMHAALVTNFTLESEDFMHSTAWFKMEVGSYMNVTYSYNCQMTTRLVKPAYEEGLEIAILRMDTALRGHLM